MDDQKKHERLVELLNKEFNYSFKSEPSTNYSEIIYIDSHKINEAVILFCDVLNIQSGSIGKRNLYSMLQKYLSDEKFQEAVNSLMKST